MTAAVVVLSMGLGPECRGQGAVVVPGVTCEGATPISSTIRFEQTIGYFDEAQWYSVQLRAGHLYRLTTSTLSGGREFSIGFAFSNAGCGEAPDLGREFFYPGVRLIYPEADSTFRLGIEQRDVIVDELSYAIELEDLGAVPDDFPSAGGPSLGEVATVIGELERPNDVDSFSVTLAANTVYQFDFEIEGVFASRSVIDFEAGGLGGPRFGTFFCYTPFPENDVCLRSCRVLSGEGGELHCRVQGQDDLGGELATGDYRLTVTNLGPVPVVDDYGNTPQTAAAIEMGVDTEAILYPAGDVDVLSFVAEEGASYRLEFARRVFYAQHVAQYSVIAPSGAETAIDSGFTATESGVHFLRIHAGTFEPTGIVTFQLRYIGSRDDFPNGSAATSQAIPLDEWTEGRIDYLGDSDAFSVVLSPGGAYRIDVEEDLDAESASVNVFVVFADARTGNASSIHGSSDGPRDAFPLLSVALAGEDMARLVVWGTNGPYRIRVMQLALPGDPDDHGGTCETATQLAPGAPVTMVLTPGDTDAVRVSLLANRLYALTAHSIPGYLEHAALVDPCSGEPAPGPYRGINVNVDTEMTVAVVWPTESELAIAEFMLHDFGPTTDREMAERRLALPIEVGVPAEGRFDFTGDIDVFGINVEPGVRYRATIRVESMVGNLDAEVSFEQPLVRTEAYEHFRLGATAPGEASESVIEFVVGAEDSGPAFLTLRGDVNDADGGFSTLMVGYEITVTAVGCTADFNGDGIVDPDDLADYINRYFSEPYRFKPVLDLNGDDRVTVDDLADYLTMYFGPCGQ